MKASMRISYATWGDSIDGVPGGENADTALWLNISGAKMCDCEDDIAAVARGQDLLWQMYHEFSCVLGGAIDSPCAQGYYVDYEKTIEVNETKDEGCYVLNAALSFFTRFEVDEPYGYADHYDADCCC